MATLLLRLAAPLQSWGIDSKFEMRKTNREPTKSGVIGLLAAALGLRRDASEAMRELNRLRFGVRVDQEGSLLTDFHTAGNLGSAEKAAGQRAKNYITWRHYLADAIFLVGLESEDDAWLEQLSMAVQTPQFPLFLGRRSCPPSQPIYIGIRPTGLEETLRTEPLLIPAWHTPPRRRVRMVLDADAQESDAARRRDQPISFSPLQRQFGYRAVKECMCLLPSDPILDETQHDPFIEL